MTPEHKALVPIDPTYEMASAGRDLLVKRRTKPSDSLLGYACDMWRAMVSAAPKPERMAMSGIKNLVERLDEPISQMGGDWGENVIPRIVNERIEAADALASQAATIRQMREALEPFAQVAEYDIGENEGDGDIYRHMDAKYAVARLPRVGDFRRARAALASNKPVGDEEWREIEQHVQPRIADGYTAVAISKPGFWKVKGPGPAAASGESIR